MNYDDTHERNAGIVVLVLLAVTIVCLWCFSSCTPSRFYEKEQNVSTRVTLREIAPMEIGYVLVWEADDGREVTESVRDTAGCNYHIGKKDIKLMKR